MTNRLRCQRGATFIEVLAAVSVFAFTVAGLSPALLSARKAAELSKSQSTATTLAEDMIEQIRGNGIGLCVTGTNLQADGTSGGIFNRTCTTGTGPISGTNLVTVAVSWRDRVGGTNTVTLVTLVRS